VVKVNKNVKTGDKNLITVFIDNALWDACILCAMRVEIQDKISPDKICSLAEFIRNLYTSYEIAHVATCHLTHKWL